MCQLLAAGVVIGVRAIGEGPDERAPTGSIAYLDDAATAALAQALAGIACTTSPAAYNDEIKNRLRENPSDGARRAEQVLDDIEVNQCKVLRCNTGSGAGCGDVGTGGACSFRGTHARSDQHGGGHGMCAGTGGVVAAGAVGECTIACSCIDTPQSNRAYGLGP
jgi:hypothetical protein